ncbi:MAG: beta-phosphoglucomutase [Crocinitomicaceae bacterium]|nr:beta-phosphoglucomutase [Crocinitomicaceae bacterium]
MKILGCLFDMDGVIVDTAKHHYIAWKSLADELAIPFTEVDNNALKGRSRLDRLECILRSGNLEVSSKTKIELMEKKNQLYLKIIDSLGPGDIRPGVKELILELRQKGVRLCLCSSSKNASSILKSIGILNLFDGIVDGNNLMLSKPDPEVFIKASKLLGLTPSACVVFEDAESGIEAARSGGFFALGISAEGSLKNAHANVKDLAHMSLDKLQAIVDSHAPN